MRYSHSVRGVEFARWVGGLAVGLACATASVRAEELAVAPESLPAPPREGQTLILPENETPPPVELQLHRFLGSQSCGASNCHGNPARNNLVLSSYHFVMDRDPHQKAGLVLYNERSRNMAERLKLGVPAWKAKECLVCHSPGAVNAFDPSLVSALVRDGIGCESCHGGAESWLAAHRSAEWKFPDIWSEERKTAAGFKTNKNLATRAHMCADCHVGSPGQQVDHDLIAAGHPRLNFEFAAYQALYPKHWRVSDDRARTPVAGGEASVRGSTFESTSWLVGQLVTADHELALLLNRAERSGKSGPELAQFDCYACHHELQDQSWRQVRTNSKLKPGEIGWGTWGLGLVESLPPAYSLLNAEQFQKDAALLRGHLQTLQARPDVIHSPATRMRAELQAALEKIPQQRYDAGSVQAVQDGLLGARNELVPGGWDRTTQLYLATAALQNAGREARGLIGGTPGADDASLLKVRQLLSFDPVSGAPRTFEITDSPRYRKGTPDEILRAFEEYLQTRPRVEAAVPADALPPVADQSPLLLPRQ